MINYFQTIGCGITLCVSVYSAPSLLELPPSTFEGVCLSLDSGTVHNWRSLVDHLTDYTMTDVRQLNIVQQKVNCARSNTNL